ncbi:MULTISPECIES: iron ABC transporter permease [Comamonas]|uniref:Iron ABC transporter permease n=1 Tax=Comamonas squillarum TaxID=2977320 RepID=A0ABY6A090_9BURK|nr:MULTISPECIES: iron ABC transporter permease [Comamonas]PWB20234.1 iron ABC transporter permease [Comamonas sp. JNW]UXC18134.1 iron ABC transporter permease [Comamonas sp. PR12]
MQNLARFRRQLLLVAIALVLVLPVLTVFSAWLPGAGNDADAFAVVREMFATVLPGYIRTTVALGLMVALGAAVLGSLCAAAVTLFDFRGRKTLEWLLLLPLAMPAYVTAYAYTDFLQFSGPLQVWMRASFGWEGRLLPEVRSLGGAVLVFVVSLYPYVYLLARTALSERAAHLMEAARLLGASMPRRIWTVALPMARPAVVAGVALVMMETLADFGVVSYFGIQTFTTGIYKAWLAMENRSAAAQLATMLLVLVLVVLQLELRAQRRMRFVTSGVGRASSAEAQPYRLQGARCLAAWLVCGLPVLLGFVLPVLFMLRPLAADWSVIPLDRFVQWAGNSIRFGAITAVLAVAIAMLAAYAARRSQDWVTRSTVGLISLGYAVPGAVIVVGLLLPVGWVQQAFPQWGFPALITATSTGIIWAYLVRFTAIALQALQSGYTRIPKSLDESARMLGVGSAGLLARVHGPLLRRSALTAALLVFVDVMKELPATMVLRPFNSDTLAVVAYQLARDERLGEAALPSLALVLVGLVPVILLIRTMRSSAAR